MENNINETEKLFRAELSELLKKYNATIEAVYSGASDMAIEVDCNPLHDNLPQSIFEL